MTDTTLDQLPPADLETLDPTQAITVIYSNGVTEKILLRDFVNRATYNVESSRSLVSNRLYQLANPSKFQSAQV